MSNRSDRLYSISQCDGFSELMAMLKEQILEPKEKLYHLISTKPEALTGRQSIKLASTAKALENFKESLEDEIKLSNPSTRIGQGS